jgi:hypothetical protein
VWRLAAALDHINALAEQGGGKPSRFTYFFHDFVSSWKKNKK